MAVAIGFLGTLVILRPGFQEVSLGQLAQLAHLHVGAGVVEGVPPLHRPGGEDAEQEVVRAATDLSGPEGVEGVQGDPAAIVEGGDEAGARGLAHQHLGRALQLNGQREKAIEYYEQQLEIARQIGDRQGLDAVQGHRGVMGVRAAPLALVAPGRKAPGRIG